MDMGMMMEHGGGWQLALHLALLACLHACMHDSYTCF